MLVITCPEFCKNEMSYTLDIIFNTRLKIPYSIVYAPINFLSIERSGKIIHLDLTFFDELNRKGHVDTSCIISLCNWDSSSVLWAPSLVESEVPVLFGVADIEEKPKSIEFRFDIIGTIFFMLSRYEEVGSNSLDGFGRFPSKASLAYRFDFLMRPIVDEYIEILWAAMRQLWPDLDRKEETFSIIPTHDVDRPFLNIGLKNIKALGQRMAGDLLRRKSIKSMFYTFIGWLHFKFSGTLRYKHDPYDVFDRLLELSDEYKIKSKFYFMTIKETGNPLFGRYDISSREIKGLIEDLSSHGHEIGMHPTGDSYKNRQDFSKQAAAFFALKDELRIDGPSGGRQHYLLWRADITPLLWEESGFQYDSTLSYSDHVGFRCGTCKAFYLWDHKEKRKINLLERPLIMMEGSLLAKENMNLDVNKAKEVIASLKRSCKVVRGEFIFLWHNSSFDSKTDWDLYELCLSKA